MNKQTYITQLLNSRPKHLPLRLLYTVVYKGTRFKEESTINAKTHLKQTVPSGTHTKKGFVKGEALRILRKTSSSETTFEENNSNFKKRLVDKGYPQTLIENLLSEITFTERKSKLLKQNNKEEKELLPFVTQYQPSVSTIKEA